MPITPPTKFSAIWANDESASFLTQPIPTGSQPAGRASLNDGFPQITFVDPVSGGGKAVDGRDMNGILYMLTAAAQFEQAGGAYAWDSAFSTAIGGYPLGAVVAHATITGFFWLNTTANNTTNPDALGAGWTGVQATSLPSTGARLAFTSATVLTLSPQAGGLLWVNGFNWSVSASPTLGNGGLSANTLYYVYAGISGGNVVLAASATGYTVGTNGIATKSGDATQTLVGMCQTNGSSQFQSGLLTRAYLQRPRAAVSSVTFGANHTTTSATFTEISSGNRNSFLVWAGENVEWNISGGFNGGATGANAATGIGFDSTSAAEPGQAIVLGPSGNNYACSIGISGVKTGLSEGLHFATLLGLTLGGTAQWYGGGTGADVINIIV